MSAHRRQESSGFSRGEEVNPESAFLWIAAFVGVVQTVYGAVKSGNRFFSNEERGLNESAVAGSGGIGKSFQG